MQIIAAAKRLDVIYGPTSVTLVTSNAPGDAPRRNVTHEGNTLEFCWPTELTRLILQSTTNLLSSEWLELSGNVLGTNRLSVTIDPSEPHRFFRLINP